MIPLKYVYLVSFCIIAVLLSISGEFLQAEDFALLVSSLILSYFPTAVVALFRYAYKSDASKSWWILPLFLGWLGSLISYLGTEKKRKQPWVYFFGIGILAILAIILELRKPKEEIEGTEGIIKSEQIT